MIYAYTYDGRLLQSLPNDPRIRSDRRRSRVAIFSVLPPPESNVQSVRGRSVRADVQSFGSKLILASRLGQKHDILQGFEGKKLE